MQNTVLDNPSSKNFQPTIRIKKSVRIWLLIGVVMVFFQVVIGGVTRLTDSGLSITEWAVIQGTLPPLNEAEWLEAFDLYKQAAKRQFETLHADMTLSEFKVIFFWEYFHRLWARLMGFVFIIPFFIFLITGWVKKRQAEWMPVWLIRRLGIVILLAAFAAVFGWIMVASGLNDDKRTWVSAYKLIIHLGIATTLFGYLFWTWLRAQQPKTTDFHFPKLKRLGWIVAFVLFVQIIFGGLMAGMRAGLIHPHFPMFVEGERLWSAFSATAEIGSQQMLDYEPNRFPKAVVQVLHRLLAYILSGLVLIFFLRIRKATVSSRLRLGSYWMLAMLIIQFLLGVFTVINSVGRIPISWGVLHQAGALILLISMLFINYQFKERSVS